MYILDIMLIICLNIGDSVQIENLLLVPALPDSTIYELERRNAELAALLQQESQTSQQQSQHITQLVSFIP